ncbi:MAG TPA: hypothetical protein DCM28_14750 [Phycisphaerales bacterium]|nr:hypothetical protein [Phycisphaerales bacterium]|tara:strand:+ start:7027 stop:8742 length:1716 start_codon:yes stop_codon:yes gene_type:complete
MAGTPQQLLGEIAMRRRVIHLSQRWYVATLVFAVIFATVLITLRLINVIDDPFQWWMVLLVPAAGLLVASVFHRGINTTQAARLADEHAHTKDLFLTATSLSTATGEYQDAVADEANHKAPTISSKQVVPYAPGNKLLHVVVSMLLLLGLVFWMPSFDLLGKEEVRQKITERKKRLEETRKTIVKRTEQLKKKDLEAENSKQVEARINALQQALRKMKPQDPKGNLKRLADQKQHIEQQWQQQKLAQSLKKNPTNQRFGNTTDQQKQWQKQMQNGKTQDLQSKMDEVKKKAEQLAQTKDPAERQKLQKDIKQSIQEMADYAMKQDGGQKMAESLQQALQQLDMSKMQNMFEEAAKAMKESMDLSQQELEQLAQSVRDMKKLEEALKTVQKAQQANNQKPLDGEACSSCNSMGDYQKLYDKMMQQANGEGQQPSPSMADAQGQGQGQSQGQGQGKGSGSKPGNGNGGGMGGAGQGQGNIAPEDDSITTNFKTEKDKSKLNAGKILLSWKTKGKAPAGQAVKDYQQSLDTIKQDAAQAIDSEQVPAGYHDAIKKYFDTIEQAQNESARTPNPQ